MYDSVKSLRYGSVMIMADQDEHLQSEGKFHITASLRRISMAPTSRTDSVALQVVLSIAHTPANERKEPKQGFPHRRFLEKQTTASVPSVDLQECTL